MEVLAHIRRPTGGALELVGKPGEEATTVFLVVDDRTRFGDIELRHERCVREVLSLHVERQAFECAARLEFIADLRVDDGLVTGKATRGRTTEAGEVGKEFRTIANTTTGAEAVQVICAWLTIRGFKDREQADVDR